METHSLEFAQLFSCFALVITVRGLDESQKRLWTFNIVEIAIDYGDI